MLADERQDTAAGFWHGANAFYSSHGISVQRVMTDNGSCYKFLFRRVTYLDRDRLMSAGGDGVSQLVAVRVGVVPGFGRNSCQSSRQESGDGVNSEAALHVPDLAGAARAFVKASVIDQPLVRAVRVTRLACQLTADRSIGLGDMLEDNSPLKTAADASSLASTSASRPYSLLSPPRSGTTSSQTQPSNAHSSSTTPEPIALTHLDGTSLAQVEGIPNTATANPVQ